jgi:hypothetical protein
MNASEVDAKLTTHEAVCAERYGKIELQFDANNARLKRIEQMLIGSAAFIIALLLGLVMKV